MSPDPLERLRSALAGRYRVERELGRGGMAVVYLAEDLKHRRPVAIKVLDTEHAEALGTERFRREIEVAARLNHPNILGLHDSGEADGFHYFVMPFVEGESLRNVLDREGPLELERATTYAREIAGALAYAHERGLVHRDIKPANVLFQAGHAVVCDFGIAKAMSEVHRDSLTRTGTSIGTFAYMSPEQLTDGEGVDGRSDIYALGCLLHEMLEGEPPFGASTPQASMAKKLMGDVARQSSRPDVPHSVWGVVKSALSVKAGDRFVTADGFASALEDAMTTGAVVKARRRRRVGALARAAAGAAAVLAIGFGGAWLAGRVGGPTYARLAVMPLTNGSGDPREEFYVAGVHEDLVSEMQRAGLRVVNASSTRRFAEAGASIRDAVNELDVDAVVQGTVERVASRVLMDVRLIDGRTEELVWSGSFSGGQADVVELLHQATLTVAEETGADLSPDAVAQLRSAAPVDAVLYELLLQARYETLQLSTESMDRAEGYYARAIARDSMSAEAWQGLASIWSFRAQQGLVPGDVARARRDSVLARAPVNVVDDAALAIQLTWPDWKQGRWDEAEAAFLSALERRPSDAVTRGYFAQHLMYRGRAGEAEREAERAGRQAPDDPLVQGLVAQVLISQHRYDEAEAGLLRARRFVPEAPYLLSTLRTTYHLQGRDSLAMESWRDSYRVNGDLEALDALEAGYRQGGYTAALRAVADLFAERKAMGREVSEWQMGTLYTRAGMYEEAIENLTLAVEEGDPNSPSVITDPIFDPMRDDPRFQALVDQMPIAG